MTLIQKLKDTCWYTLDANRVLLATPANMEKYCKLTASLLDLAEIVTSATYPSFKNIRTVLKTVEDTIGARNLADTWSGVQTLRSTNKLTYTKIVFHSAYGVAGVCKALAWCKKYGEADLIKWANAIGGKPLVSICSKVALKAVESTGVVIGCCVTIYELAPQIYATPTNKALWLKAGIDTLKIGVIVITGGFGSVILGISVNLIEHHSQTVVKTAKVVILILNVKQITKILNDEYKFL